MAPKLSTLLVSFIALVGLDQATKEWTIAHIPYPARGSDEVVLIPNLLSLTHARNDGAAFSMMENFEYRMVVFAIFTVIALVGLVWGYRQLRDDDRLQAAAIGLILAGAVGNAIDRVRFQMVTDMVKMYAGFEPAKSWLIQHAGTYIWPIWNVADACILVGVVLFGLQYFFEKEPAAPSADDVGRAPDPL